jgi:hypothetical protein
MKMTNAFKSISGVAAMIVASSFLVTSAGAEEAASSLDRKCAILSLYLAGQEDKDFQQTGVLASYFYLGRLQARSPELATAKALSDYAMKTPETELTAEGDRCLDDFERAGSVFADIAKVSEPETRK